MYTTEKTVTLLKTIAIIAGLAITLWSLGLPYLHLADAANITTVSDVLSDSAPSANSNHTITFTTPSGVDNGDSIVISFDNFDVSGVDEDDMDLLVNDSNVAASNWAGSFVGNDLTIVMGTAIAPAAEVTILVGLHATNEGSPTAQIGNPAGEGSYELGFTVGDDDSGWTRVVILSGVEVSAAVDTIFTFTVAGLPAGSAVNGVTTSGATGSTSIPFGTLVANDASTTAQQLTVSTNAANGYTVTVQVDQQLESSTGAVIDGFSNGSYTNTPTTWQVPSATLGVPATYGHWGITSNDATTTRSAEFDSNEWVSASTSPIVVMSHDGPANGTGHQARANVGYQVEISSLQEAGDDYQAVVTYVATPTF
jgi:hypothetical protein